jgi:DNA-binding transcriptional ArsR family regulator
MRNSSRIVWVIVSAALTAGAAAQAATAARPAPTPAVAQAVVLPSIAESRLKLGQCRVEAHRNAKLYALRAHGIRILRSADRAQTRAVNALDALLAEVRGALAGRGDLVARLDAAEDASTSLTELTVQEPVVGQIRAAEEMAERTATACEAVQAALAGEADARQQVAEAIQRLQWLSQRIARTYLAAPLTRALDAQQQQGLRTDAAAFEQALAALRTAGATDVTLREHVLFVDSQWVFYRAARARPRETREGLEHVGRVSEHLYEMFEDELVRRRRRP